MLHFRKCCPFASQFLCALFLSLRFAFVAPAPRHVRTVCFEESGMNFCNEDDPLKDQCNCDHFCLNRKDCCVDYWATCTSNQPLSKLKNDLGRALSPSEMNAQLLIQIPIFVTFLLMGVCFARCAIAYIEGTIVQVNVDQVRILDRILCFRFNNCEVEHAYQSWNQDYTLNICTKMLLCLQLFILSMVGLSVAEMSLGTCTESTRSNSFSVWFQDNGDSCILFILNIVFNIFIASRPNCTLYYCCLCTTAFCLVLVISPEFQMSCRARWEHCKHIEDSSSVRSLFAVRFFGLDCSILGGTGTIAGTVLLLSLPSLVPRYENVHVMWLWIFGNYDVVHWVQSRLLEYDVHTPFAVFHKTLLLYVALVIATSACRQEERSKRRRFLLVFTARSRALDVFLPLCRMMPNHVVLPLIRQTNDVGSSYAEKSSIASVLSFSIGGFESLTRSMPAANMVDLMGSYFARFDEALEVWSVTKIASYGNNYFAAVGILPQDQVINAVKCHVILLERLFECAAEILSIGRSIDVRVGVSTGPVATGVIGRIRPTYILFGETVDFATRLMQEGTPGTVQFGTSTYETLPCFLLGVVAEKGEVELEDASATRCWEWDGVSRQHPQSQSGFAQNDMTTWPTGLELFEDAFDSLREQDSNLIAERTIYRLWYEKHVHQLMENSASVGKCWIIIFVLIVTLIEYEACFVISFAYRLPHDVYGSGDRTLWFVYFRACMVFAMQAQCYPGIPKAFPLKAKCREALILIFDVFVLLLVGFAFDAVRFSNSVIYKNVRVKLMKSQVFVPSEDMFLSFWLLVFVYIALNAHGHRYKPSLVFLVAVVLLLFQPLFCKQFAKYAVSDDPYMPQLTFAIITQVLMRIGNAKRYESNSLAFFTAQHQLDRLARDCQNTIDTMLPPMLVQDFVSCQSLPHHLYRNVCLMQSSLCGLRSRTAMRRPMEMVQDLDTLSRMFDDVIDAHGACKIEIGAGGWVAVMASPPLSYEYSPLSVARIALDIVDAALEWALLKGERKLSFRAGVHYGECVGGIVGISAQRYQLFGHTVSRLQLLEISSSHGMVQASEEFVQEFERENRDVSARDVLFTPRQNWLSEDDILHEVVGNTFWVERFKADKSVSVR